MAFQKTFIPYGAYWSTPFARWQGSLANQHSIELAAKVARAALAERGIAPERFDALRLGLTVPQRSSFYGAPWLASLIGAETLSGPTVAQACATSARLLAGAALEIETGEHRCVLNVACDRTSNGPHVYYPDPHATGGTGGSEDPVLDSFNRDPNTRAAMIQTAENVAREAGITREQQDEMTLLRSEQYAAALADERAFQRRYMVAAPLVRGRKQTGALEADEGVHPTDAEGLAALRPVLEGGTVTYGTQTHPADGNAALVLCDEERARELSRDGAVTIRLLGYGEARVERAMMPKAVVPAARDALQRCVWTERTSTGSRWSGPGRGWIRICPTQSLGGTRTALGHRRDRAERDRAGRSENSGTPGDPYAMPPGRVPSRTQPRAGPRPPAPPAARAALPR